MRAIALTMSLIALVAVSAATPAYFAWNVSRTGFGPVALGMTVPDASRLFGRDIANPDGGGFMDENCSTYAFGEKGKLGDFRFLVASNQIRRIDVYRSGISTELGIGVGSTVEEVRKAYPVRKEYVGHYQDEQVRIVLSKRTTLIFDFQWGYSKNVTSFRIGLAPEINFIEGCA